MSRLLNSFKVRSNGKILDYRQGESLNLNEVRSYFKKSYHVKKIRQGSRHVLGILTKDDVDYFLKLSTSEGISVVTKNEYEWNDYFNKHFSGTNYCVPKNYDNGLYRDKYFYLITDYFNGKLLCETRQSYEDVNKLITYLPQIIELSEAIQKLPGTDDGYKARFVDKTKAWFGDIPADISQRYKVTALLEIVEKGTGKLSSKVRHGDFTPWHIIKLADDKLGLIDGEHFLTGGVEGYDICYFIQRVFSVLKNPSLAKEIYAKLLLKGYKKDKLQVVLAARAIGGFLDESLREKPDYRFAISFKDWVMGV